MIKTIINLYLIRLISLITFYTLLSCGVFRANICIENKRISSLSGNWMFFLVGVDVSLQRYTKGMVKFCSHHVQESACPVYLHTGHDV